MNRRDALRNILRIGGAGAALAAGFGAVRCLDGFALPGRRGRLVSAARLGMGTVVDVSAADPSRARAEDALAAAFAELDRLEPLLTRFDPAAPLAVLNSHGRLDAPPACLTAVLDEAHRAHQATARAFDPTVLPLLAYVQGECAAGREPDPGEISARRDLAGLDRVSWSSRKVEFTRAGMALTLDGVAKGWIADAMAAALRRAGVRHGLVDAGGDIRAFGGKADGLPWTVAVRDPENPEAVRERIELTDGACTTSGDYEVYFDPQRRHHHILDPATGQSPRLAHSATVLADTAARADALSTALLVLGPAGRGLVERQARRVILG
ncbi:MAG: FAD:protein FMN transferase [Thermodesulfobacteriota bacterium]